MSTTRVEDRVQRRESPRKDQVFDQFSSNDQNAREGGQQPREPDLAANEALF